MEETQTFFNFAAEVGLTKQFGGIAGTEELMALCHISEGQTILDVGCGAGVTPCHIAKKHGCKVVGVDIRARMIERCEERARKEKISGKVEFRVADAQELPFEDGLFDAVITESVTAILEDKQRAVNEYVRVTKIAGYVGINEATWLKASPPPELFEWVSQDVGGNARPLTSDGWVELMERAGLKEIAAIIHEINPRDETKGLLQRYGYRGFLGIMLRMFSLYVRNPAYRKFVKGVQKGGIIPENIGKYFGYGMYVGRK